MLDTLLDYAVVIFVAWLILVIFAKVGSVLIKLLCILILIALGWLLLSFLSGCRATWPFAQEERKHHHMQRSLMEARECHQDAQKSGDWDAVPALAEEPLCYGSCPTWTVLSQEPEAIVCQ